MFDIVYCTMVKITVELSSNAAQSLVSSAIRMIFVHETVNTIYIRTKYVTS